MAIEHRGVGTDAVLMDLSSQIYPPFRGGLVFADLAPHLLIEDLRPAARTRIEPGLAQFLYDILIGLMSDPLEMVDLDHSEGFQVKIRVAALQGREQVEIIIE